MKSVIVQNIRRQFKDMMDKPLFVLATSVDPCYRMGMFDAEHKATALQTAVQQEWRPSANA